jgi:hypothetical protein
MFRVLSKFARLFVMVVLLCLLMCSEFPELVRLADNTANDFTTQSCLASEVAIALAIQVVAKAPASGITARPESLCIPKRLSLFGISPDLLLLYSVLRT